MTKIQIILTTALLILLIGSCKKESFITSPDARLSLSADSIKFDTVLTSVGSITQSFKIFNDNDQKLRLSKIKLMGGPVSAFKLNINGLATTEQDNIEIAANDSIYVFVTVSINPTSANLPFIISDSVLISYNGNERFVQLQAYGQNAHFLRDQVISTHTTWINDLPYVILGGIRIDTNIRLTINEGCRVYSHADAAFLVDGTLVLDGNKGNEILFASDRLDDLYRDFPGGWPGIYFRGSSKNNQMTFAIVKNAYRGIVLQEPASNSNPKLVMHQCIIDNAFDAGFTSSNSSAQVDNTLISNCGRNIRITLGGDYTFTNCTVVTYSGAYLLHNNPVLVATNFEDQNGVVVNADLSALFRNCIFWGDGNVEDELIIDKAGSNPFNVTFDHCLYKALNDPGNSTITDGIRNQDPSFDSIDVNHNYYDFRVTKNSLAPGIDQGTPIPYLKDLDDNTRSVGLPDLGSYEKQ